MDKPDLASNGKAICSRQLRTGGAAVGRGKDGVCLALHGSSDWNLRSGETGQETLLEAKIIAVADVVEAVYSPRPYRPAWGRIRPWQISNHKGSLYDPEVVGNCVKLFEQRAVKLD
jgi:hypothetical protein